MTTDEVKAAVDAVLTRNKLPVTDDERAGLERTYLIMQQMAADLRIPEVRYGSPATIYPATLER